jgi:UDP-N-acetylmuramyl pentapeptide phosphotransferase/UDP-N-acetylglucosamine-1-phosphate transferase
VKKLVPIVSLAFCKIGYAIGLWIVSIYPVTYQQFDKFRFGLTPTLSLICICFALYIWTDQRKSSKWFCVEFASMALLLTSIVDIFYLWKVMPKEKLAIEVQFALLGNLVIALAVGAIAFTVRERNDKDVI